MWTTCSLFLNSIKDLCGFCFHLKWCLNLWPWKKEASPLRVFRSSVKTHRTYHLNHPSCQKTTTKRSMHSSSLKNIWMTGMGWILQRIPKARAVLAALLKKKSWRRSLKNANKLSKSRKMKSRVMDWVCSLKWTEKRRQRRRKEKLSFSRYLSLSSLRSVQLWRSLRW